jgi:hypothetical protein
MTDASLSTGNVTGGAAVVGSPAYIIVYNLLATAPVGSAAIVASPELSFDNGLRWPIVPNWKNEVEEVYEFKTDIITFRSLTEQRRARRTNPRKSWSYKAMPIRDDFRAAQRIITDRFDQITYAANPLVSVYTESDLSAGGNTFDVSSVPDWLVADAVCQLSYNNGVRALVKVKSVAGSTVTTYGVVGATYPSGARLRPTEACRIDAGTKLGMAARGVAIGDITLNVEPGSLYYPDPPAATDTFNGRELFLKSPNWKSTVNLDFGASRESVDYDQGRVTLFSLSSFMYRNWRGTYLGRSQAEVKEVVDFFRRMKGMQGEFYAPTGLADLVPIANLTGGTKTLKTAGPHDYGVYALGDRTSSREVNKAVFVKLKNGNYEVNTISNVVLSGSDSVFNCGNNWSTTMAPENIAYVSYLPVCRLASDTLTIQWETAGVAQFALAFRTLEALAAE